jgi:multidrug efflux pump subunit AcrA (membrane-fusion protein)
MSNSVIHAFFVGRAIAQALGEQLEDALTNALSEVGKFDAEQRERLRQFTEQVMERAERDAETVTLGRTTTAIVPIGSQPVDLQATIDELRAEIARLRAELQLYRNQSV